MNKQAHRTQVSPVFKKSRLEQEKEWKEIERDLKYKLGIIGFALIALQVLVTTILAI